MQFCMSATSTGILTKLPVQIVKMTFNTSTAPADTLEVQDNSGHVIWHVELAGGPTYMEFNPLRPLTVNGINISTLTAGRVDVTYC